jgi:hypothetical protein
MRSGGAPWLWLPVGYVIQRRDTSGRLAGVRGAGLPHLSAGDRISGRTRVLHPAGGARRGEICVLLIV